MKRYREQERYLGSRTKRRAWLSCPLLRKAASVEAHRVWNTTKEKKQETEEGMFMSGSTRGHTAEASAECRWPYCGGAAYWEQQVYLRL